LLLPQEAANAEPSAADPTDILEYLAMSSSDPQPIDPEASDPLPSETQPPSGTGKPPYGWLNAAALGLIVGALVAGGTWLFLPKPKHTAHTWVNVSRTPRKLFVQGNEAPEDFDDFKRSQIALVKSRYVLNAALRDKPHLSTLHEEGVDPTELLSDQLVVDFDVNPTTMQISMTGDNENELETIVNAVAKAYIEEIVLKERGRREVELQELEKLRKTAQDNMRLRQANLKMLGANDPIVVVVQRDFVNKQLAAAELKVIQVRERLWELTAILHVERVPLVNAVTLMGSPLDQWPILAPLTLPHQSNTGSVDIASLANQIKIQTELEKTANAAVDNLANQAQALTPGGNKDVNFVETRVIAGNAEEVFKYADAAVEMAKLNLNAQSRITRSSEEGVVIHGKDLKRRIIATSVAGASGFFLVMLAVGIIDFRNRRRQSAA
jgi:hypothetical protein